MAVFMADQPSLRHRQCQQQPQHRRAPACQAREVGWWGWMVRGHGADRTAHARTLGLQIAATALRVARSAGAARSWRKLGAARAVGVTWGVDLHTLSESDRWPCVWIQRLEKAMKPLLEQIEALFEAHGAQARDGTPEAPVSALSHALQTAQLAEWADAESPLVAAALLHDLGHFLVPPAEPGSGRVPHEQRALGVLAEGFGPEVLEPIRLHVQAKRYLVATDPSYARSLTPRSRRALQAQGGPMSRAEQRGFEQTPHALGAVKLRQWDDRAKEAGKRTPPLAYYLGVLEEVLQAPIHQHKIEIGARSAA